MRSSDRPEGDRTWVPLVGGRTMDRYRQAGFGTHRALGVRPALLVVDVTYEFCGDPGIRHATAQWPKSCGDSAWHSVGVIRAVVDKARALRVPVIYTKPAATVDSAPGGYIKGAETTSAKDGFYDPFAIVAEIAPHRGDWIFTKRAPSAFFDTGLAKHLRRESIDTVLVCGGTTSGCIRATAVDAFSHRIPLGVLEPGSFDRGEVPHTANLFDLAMKYAHVMSDDEVIKYLNSVPAINGLQSDASGSTGPDHGIRSERRNR